MTLNFFLGVRGLCRKTIYLRTKNFMGKGRLLSEPALSFVLLALVFIDKGNPSKIFKVASNSFEVTYVPF